MNIKLLFLHIPKTGGNSLIKTLTQLFLENEVYKTPIDENFITDLNKIFQARFIYGHQFYSFFDTLGQGIRCTLLRDPVDRTISAYEYICWNITNPYHKLLIRKNKPLKDLLWDDEFSYHFSNLQTRMLGCIGDFSQVIRMYEAGKMNISVAKGEIKKMLLIKPTIKNLEIAKERIMIFDIIGILEEYESFIQKLTWVLELPNTLEVFTENSTPKILRENRNIKYMDIIDIIKESNSLDMELYDFAKAYIKENNS